MKTILILFTTALTLASSAADFHVYLPSRTTSQLWIVKATETGKELSFSVIEKVALDFTAATIVAHPEKPFLYVSTTRGDEGNSPGATVTLNADGNYKSHASLILEHGYSYLSLDRDNRFLLGADYGGGHIDVYPIDEHGVPGTRIAFLNEGRNAAHAVLPSPDNKFVYIPYVKDSNAILQYAFDTATGKLTPLNPPNANPPEGTGPRHIAYHPIKPFVYFSNEQGIGASVYKKTPSGALTFIQSVDVFPTDERPESAASASDCAITPDGQFLFTGQRSADESALPNGINRYRVLEDGKLQHLGHTSTREIPWGIAFSPDAKYLLTAAFKGGTLHAFRITKKGDLKEAATLPIDKSISDLVTR
ncbi:MAG: beta-propeller fold lactonase family protein [Verrucomicrobiota bacterium]